MEWKSLKDFRYTTECLADLFDLDPLQYHHVEVMQSNLSVRTKNCLFKAGLDTIEKMLQYQLYKMICLQGFGVGCMNDLFAFANELTKKKEASYNIEKSEQMTYIEKQMDVCFSEIFQMDSKNYSDVKLNEYEYSIRTSRRLEAHSIETLSQLLAITPNDLLKISGFGRGCLEEIFESLRYFSKYRKKTIENNINEKKESFISAVKKHFDSIRNRNYDDLLTIENTDITRLIVEYFKKNDNWIDYDLLWYCLSNDDNSKRIIDLLSRSIDRLSIQSSIHDLLKSIPKERRKNAAFYYINAFTINPAERKALFDCYQDSSQPLESIFTGNITKNNEKLVVLFLKWCAYDIQESITSLINNIYKDERDRTIIQLREKGYTLNDVGNHFGMTRERVRQIEAKVKRKFLYWQSRQRLLARICADRDGDTVLTIDELAEYFGEYTDELVYLFKSYESSVYKYSNQMNVFIIDIDGTIENEVTNYVDQLPDVFRSKDLNRIYDEAGENEGLSVELLKKCIESTYSHTGDLYHRVRLRKSDLYCIILKKYFPDGVHIYDPLEMQRFRQYLKNEFGEIKTSEDRGIIARVADLGILCGRGTYKAKQDHYISDELLNDIEKYVSNSEAPVIMISSIYNMFEERLIAEGVHNHYYLQGILHELFGNKFYFSKDYISNSAKTMAVNDMIRKCIKEKKYPVSTKELQNIFPGVSQITVNAATNIPEILSFWGKFFYVGNLRASLPERNQVLLILERLTKNGEVCHSSDIYKAILADNSDLLSRNYILDHYSCYSVLAYWYGSKFQFDRPFVAQQGIEIGRPFERLHEFVYSSDEIYLTEVTDFVKENKLRWISLLTFANECNDKYLLSSNERMVSINQIGIDEDKAKEVESVVLPYVSKTVPIRDIPCFNELPSINEPWTDWLVYSVLRKWSNKLCVGESSNQIRLAVPLVAPTGMMDPSVVDIENKMQSAFVMYDLDQDLDRLVTEFASMEDLDNI